MGLTDRLERVLALSAQLGEGPVWVARERALWLVDIKGRRLHRYDPQGGAHSSWEAPEQPGFVLPVRGGGFLAGLKTGLHRFDPDSGAFTHRIEVEPQLPTNRLNDAAVGPDGALWFGSMDDLEADRTGVVYRLQAGGRPEALDKGYVITNGPAWSPDGRVFYHTDTAGRTVYAFDLGSDGALSDKRVLTRIEDEAGWPDGSAVDAEGCIWVALYGGWGVRRYSPGGELLGEVRFPCANVTKIAFGGDDLCTVYATTAWKGLTPTERQAQPWAGDLFRFRVQTPGLPARELILDS